MEARQRAPHEIDRGDLNEGRLNPLRLHANARSLTTTGSYAKVRTMHSSSVGARDFGHAIRRGQPRRRNRAGAQTGCFLVPWLSRNALKQNIAQRSGRSANFA
jgi:hypothetical protein